MRLHGGLDVLVNNAGVAFWPDASEPLEFQAKVTMDVNYYGTKLVSTVLQPLIRDGGRVVNVCSQAGVMRNGKYGGVACGEKWIRRMSDLANLTEKQIDDFVEEYKIAVKEDATLARGFPQSAYRASKTAEIAYTLLQAKALRARNIRVNACCPGYVATDMSRHKGELSAEEGADTPIFLALDAHAPHGEFVFERKAIPWY